MTDRDPPGRETDTGPDTRQGSRTPKSVRMWVILFAVVAVLAAGGILYAFTTRFGQTATPGAAPVGGSRPSQ